MWRAFHALNHCFAEGGEKYLELLDPEIEWIPIMSLTDGRTYRGHDGVRRWMEDARAAWRVHRTPWSRIDALGGGRVVALGSWECVGRAAGVEMRFDQAAWLMDVREGRITRLEAFADRGEALHAAGVRAA